MTIITTGPMTMPRKPNMVIPANTDSSISAESSLASLGTRIGRSTLSILVTTDEVEDDHEDPADDVAEQRQPDAERDGDDAAAQRDHRQRRQQDREDEEPVVEAGDVDRDGAGDALSQGDDELAADGAAHHGRHLGQVQVGGLFAERVEPADQQPQVVAVDQQRDEHVQEDDRGGQAAEQAAGRTLQELQAPLTGALGERDHPVLQLARR